ncbi:MAG: hypothetical protein ACE145_01715 [Terriglobia bacterium]
MKTRIHLDQSCIFLSCVIALFSFLTPARAERPARGDGGTIKGKLEEVLGKTEQLGATLEGLCDSNCQATEAGQKFKGRVDRIREAQTRANRSSNRTDGNDFQQLVRKRGRKKSEECDPQLAVCLPDQTASLSMVGAEPEFDEERGKDMVEDLDEVGTEVSQLNEVLAGNVPKPPPTVYAELDKAEYFFPPSMWPSSKVAFAAFTANLAAEKASAIATHFCDQTAVALGFGGNGSAACAAVEGVHQVLDAIYQMMDYISQDVTSSEVTGTYKRVGNVYEQLLGSSGDINAVKIVVEAMGQKLLQLEENQKYIIQLLTTPQGQRPSFPKPATATSSKKRGGGR